MSLGAKVSGSATPPICSNEALSFWLLKVTPEDDGMLEFAI